MLTYADVYSHSDQSEVEMVSAAHPHSMTYADVCSVWVEAADVSPHPHSMQRKIHTSSTLSEPTDRDTGIQSVYRKRDMTFFFLIC